MAPKDLKQGAIAVLAVAVASTIPAIALAYVLPADAIFSTMARKRVEIDFKTLVAEGTYQAGGGPPVSIWEVMIPGRVRRIERKSKEATEITLIKENKRWSYRIGEKAAPSAKAPPDIVLTFLGANDKDPGGARGSAFLRSRGIDESTVSLSRLDKRAAYVIGAKPWEANKPQLWVDKEYYLPCRLIEVDKQSGSITDTRFLGYGSAVTGEWYPQKIEVWKDGNLVESTTYTSARLNEEVNDDLLKPPS
jgi:outer membrane lipoprotein-sorting protein